MNAELARKSLDSKLYNYKKWATIQRPHRGWIKAIREALEMSTAQMGKRMGVTQPRITKLEQAELEESVTLASMRRAAEALDCTFVYAFVPHQSLENIIKQRAKTKALKIMSHVNHTMVLENQNLRNTIVHGQIEEIAATLIRERSRTLWDDDKS